MSRTENLREVMKGAWRTFRVTGKSFAECLKQSWMVVKLKAAMHTRKVEFYYQKINGEIRQAFGTLIEGIVGATKGTRKPSEDLLTYWDCEKNDWRCCKKFNLIRVA